ncbi:uncharacterized protein PGTG_13579 [Puccinia graminis f. sp. tritici CRL 75-36-700-3]|uniref:Uncharacterized protein n=1 Tax=Puccinia graminis f. sp. tritici (strain CRL 75-36-700-3 / race SCCL) TaxID=418459 RepID=E3KSW5_PUCGT|nr:uncharacterized protein PGTG_13579 [Puccinia graminis f. sp. tritici CRL 75-36-700-3]EFP87351.1 hypothetical protein PGTG_13579 [Puccinia graminis f. sp. tritici CRL 75-36-700-3]
MHSTAQLQLPSLHETTNPKLRDLTTNKPSHLPYLLTLRAQPLQAQRAKQSVMQSNAGVNLQFNFVDTNVRLRKVPNSSNTPPKGQKVIKSQATPSNGAKGHQKITKSNSQKLGANTSLRYKFFSTKNIP